MGAGRGAWVGAVALAGCFSTDHEPPDLRLSVTASVCPADCEAGVEVPLGFGGQLWAFVYFESGERLGASEVTWSWDASVIDLPAGGGEYVEDFVAVGPGTTTVTVRSDGAEDARELTVTGIDALELEVLEPIVAVGATIEIVAFAVASSGDAYDVRGSVAGTADWTTSDPDLATVDGGIVTGLSPGDVTITASYQGRSASAPLTVTE